MKIYLDDVRTEPTGWIRCYWPDEVIDLLKKKKVTHLSLDHDLGDDNKGTGYDVLLWIEQKIITEEFDGNFIPPIINIHSANPVAKKKMLFSVSMIYRQFQIFNPVEYGNWRSDQ